jgi:hypothetical protein
LNLLRVLHTVKCLRRIQILYQIFYRIKKRFISIKDYDKYLRRNLIHTDLKISTLLQAQQPEYLGNNKFCYIGLTHSFTDAINWNFEGHGKLWNYNLQYFNFLLDENIALEERTKILHDFSQKLLSSFIPLEPYPVSLRIINTLIFHSRYQITDPVIIEALQRQIAYLEKNIEYHLLANHVLENGFSLFIAAYFISDKSLLLTALSIVIPELREQILDDGGHFEGSVMYHSLILSKLLLCIEIARKTKWVEDNELKIIEETASRMLGWIKEYSFPDGTWALMNDAAEGIAPTTNSLLNAGRLINIYPTEISFSCSVYRKIRGLFWEIIIKTDVPKPKYQPAHSHADIGSFCLWYRGEQLLVDPGISTYNNTAIRTKERSTLSHNTIAIERKNQSDVWSSFRVGKRAFVSLLDASSSCVKLRIIPFHSNETIHERTFNKLADDKFVIHDNLKNTKSTTNQVGSLQFSTGIEVNQYDTFWEAKNMRLVFKNATKVELDKGSYSTHFNQHKIAARIFYYFNTSCELGIELL